MVTGENKVGILKKRREMIKEAWIQEERGILELKTRKVEQLLSNLILGKNHSWESLKHTSSQETILETLILEGAVMEHAGDEERSLKLDIFKKS